MAKTRQNTTKNQVNLKFDLGERLKQLPANQQRLIKNAVVLRSGVSESTYYNTISGSSTNLVVLMALSNVLNCSLDDIVNPLFQFKNPELKEPVPDMISTLGLSPQA